MSATFTSIPSRVTEIKTPSPIQDGWSPQKIQFEKLRRAATRGYTYYEIEMDENNERIQVLYNMPFTSMSEQNQYNFLMNEIHSESLVHLFLSANCM